MFSHTSFLQVTNGVGGAVHVGLPPLGQLISHQQLAVPSQQPAAVQLEVQQQTTTSTTVIQAAQPRKITEIGTKGTHSS